MDGSHHGRDARKATERLQRTASKPRSYRLTVARTEVAPNATESSRHAALNPAVTTILQRGGGPTRGERHLAVPMGP